MQKSEGMAKSTQRQLKSSTTLNRRYVKRPVKKTDMVMGIQRSSKIQHFKVDPLENRIQVKVVESKQQTPKQQVEPIEKHPLQVSAIDKMQQMRSQQISNQQEEKKMTAKEIKDRAIQQALVKASATEQVDDAKKSKKQKIGKMHFGFGRVALALSCAAVAVLAIVYFVNLNMPDLSLRVAAMQTGINASYPGHIPSGYAVSSITSENRKIVLDFKNSSKNDSFTLTEETSSWDSNALLNNFIKEEYGDNYKTVKEQGLTIYISNSNAAWVNGGVAYKITAENGVLTNKQICAIATSL